MTDTASSSPINKKFSAAIAEPILAAHKQGGLALAFLVLGALMLFASIFLDKTNPVYWFLGILGFLLIVTVIVLFYYRAIRPLRSLSARIDSNSEMVDSIQSTAVELSEIASLLQATAFKHAETLKEVLNNIAEYARPLPVVGPKVADYVEGFAEDYSPAIVDLTDEAKGTIEGLKTALVNADSAKLAGYADELIQLRQRLNDALAVKTETSNKHMESNG